MQLECVRVLQKSLLVPVLTYGSEILLWKEKEGSIIMCEQMNNLKDLLSIKRIDRMPNAWVTYLCGVNEGVDKRIKETRWFGHIGRVGNDRIA